MRTIGLVATGVAMIATAGDLLSVGRWRVWRSIVRRTVHTTERTSRTTSPGP